MSLETSTPSVACGRARDRCGRSVGAGERRLHRPGPIGRVAHSGQGDRRARDAAISICEDDRRDADQCVPGRGLLEGDIGRAGVVARSRKADLGQELARPEAGRANALPKNPSTPVVRSPPADRMTSSASSASRRRQVRGGVAMGDRAADRSPVSHLDVADMRQGITEHPSASPLTRKGRRTSSGRRWRAAHRRAAGHPSRQPARYRQGVSTAARRSLRRGRRLWPPARTFAPGSDPRIRRASSMDAGRW